MARRIHTSVLIAAIFSLTLLASACISYHVPPASDAAQGARSAHFFARTGNDRQKDIRTGLPAHMELFEYDWRMPAPLDAICEKHDGRYDVCQLVLAVKREDADVYHLIRGTFLKSDSPAAHKLVVIFPVYGSVVFPSKIIAEFLTARNEFADTHVLVFDGAEDVFRWDRLADAATEEDFFREVAYARNTIRYTVIGARRAIDWAMQKTPGIDRGRIGVVGFSVSVPIAALTLGVDRRITAGAFIFGGGSFQHIFASTEEAAISATRAKILARFGWTQEAFEAKLAFFLDDINPERFVRRVDPRRVLFLEAEYDTYISAESRRRLWEALGRPQKTVFPYWHKPAFLSMTVLGLYETDRLIAAFLYDRL